MSEPITYEALAEAEEYGTVQAFVPKTRFRAFGIDGFTLGDGTGFLAARVPRTRASFSGVQSQTGIIAANVPRTRAVMHNAGGTNTLRATVPRTRAAFRDSAIPIPTVNMIEAYVPKTRAVVTGVHSQTGSVTATVPRTSVFMHDGGGVNTLRATVPRTRAIAGNTPILDTHFYLQYPEPYVVMWFGAFYSQITDSVAFTDSLTVASWVWRVREQFGLTDSAASLLTGTSQLTDQIAFADALQIVWRVYVAETLALSDTPSGYVTALRSVIDTLVLSDVASSQLQAISALATTIALQDDARFAWHAAVVEAITLNDTLDSRVAAIGQILETLVLGDTLTPSFTVMAVMQDSIALADTATGQLTATNLLRESLGFLARFTINGDQYSAWVINTESKGVSRYTNYPFNSFAQLPDGTYFGCARTGLYTLDGDTDDGTAIDAGIRDGLSDMGSRVAKRVPEMFLGYRSDGGLILKVIASSDGAKTEWWYALSPRTADEIRESRFKAGRGIKSVYLAWEIVNVNGADFELDTIEWEPLRLDRRLT